MPSTGTDKINIKPLDTGEKPAGIAHLFHLLGTDSPQNISLILEQARFIIQGPFAFFIPLCPQDPAIQANPGLPHPLEIKHILTSTLFNQAFATDEETHLLSCIQPREGDPLVDTLGIKSCIGVPVFFKQNRLGALWVVDIRPRDFTPDDIESLQTLAAALGLEKERLSRENKMLEAQRATIRKLNKKLSQANKMELLGVIAGGVAHDLNNILAGLVSYPELLLLQIDKNSPLVEPISFIHDTGLKAADIVQDLLTLTRRGIKQTSVINLNQVIQDYHGSSVHQRLLKNFPNIHFKIKTDPWLLNLNGSESHISKVVMNLVMNAAEAVKDSGQVMIETFNRYVDTSLDGNEIPEGEYAVLRVTDDGEGISREDIKRIFEPFYTKKQMGRSGSGLGLSVVWNAVKDHKGYIEISSKKKEGTSFELYFPGTRDRMESIPDNFNLDAFKGNNETVLVVDDVKEQREIAQGCLKILGYRPFTVGSGKEAVTYLKKQPMDLLVLDMRMEPGMDGLNTYKEVLKIYPKQKAIIASGFSETQRVKEAKQLGAGQYIKKPYTLQNFAVALKKELAKNQ
jgi:two-component system, cell cycle sensor histidine kinase and response regulator CckA